MKHNLLIISMVAITMSCGGKVEKPAAVDSSAAKTEKITTDTLKTEVAVESADHLMMQIKGDVKSVEQWHVLTDENGNDSDDKWRRMLYEFDKEGNLTDAYYLSDYSKERLRIKRNKAGQVATIQEYIADWKAWFDTDYTYDERGFVVTCLSDGVDGKTKESYVYDADGNLIKSNAHSVLEGEDYYTTTTYTITGTDSHGNWNSRKLKSTTKSEGTKETEIKNEYRTITYR